MTVWGTGWVCAEQQFREGHLLMLVCLEGDDQRLDFLESAPTRRHPTSGSMTALILQRVHPELIHDGDTHDSFGLEAGPNWS